MPRDRYIQALMRDLDAEQQRSGGRTVESIFLGGGTPSLFTPSEIARLIEHCETCLNLADDCEITMEANPGTIERGALSGYRSAGINRLSLGAQSFSPQMLSALGRIHSCEDIGASYAEAVAANFDSINIDLMFALPGQTLDMAIADMEQLLQLDSPHISYYQLTLEPNTGFAKRPPSAMPDDSLAWDIQTECHAMLSRAGYGQYEISAFAIDGHRCRHNLNYWSFGDYLAVGAGAHGKITRDGYAISRYQKPANPLLYMKWIEDVERQLDETPVLAGDLGFEFMLNALRLTDGIPTRRFEACTGETLQSIAAPLEKAVEDGLLTRTAADYLVPTAQGFRFLNDLQARFLE